MCVNADVSAVAGGPQSMGGEGMTDEERKLKQQKAMADPEIQARRPPFASPRSAANRMALPPQGRFVKCCRAG